MWHNQNDRKWKWKLRAINKWAWQNRCNSNLMQFLFVKRVRGWMKLMTISREWCNCVYAFNGCVHKTWKRKKKKRNTERVCNAGVHRVLYTCDVIINIWLCSELCTPCAGGAAIGARPQSKKSQGVIFILLFFFHHRKGFNYSEFIILPVDQPHLFPPPQYRFFEIKSWTRYIIQTLAMENRFARIIFS